jgi:hypothetical protein
MGPIFLWIVSVIYIMFGLFSAVSLKDEIINISYDSRRTLFARDPDNNFIKEFCAEVLYIRTKSRTCTNDKCCTKIIVKSLSDDMINILAWKHSSIWERLFYFPDLSYPELMKKYKKSLKI